MDVNILGFLCNLLITAIGLISSLMSIEGYIKEHASTSTSRVVPRWRKLVLPLAFIFIFIFGCISLYLWVQPQYSIWYHQNLYNQTIGQTPMKQYLLQNPNVWETKPHPHGDSGDCRFQNQTYDITMTRDNSFYPCYSLATPLQNFLCLVEMRIIKGDGGGIIFRDDSRRPDLYYLFIAENGAYDLNYWPSGTASAAILLLSGTSSDFFHDQVQNGRRSLVAIAAKGSDISVYIDGTYAKSTQDSRIPGGRIALTAQKILNATEVIYDQVEVWPL